MITCTKCGGVCLNPDEHKEYSVLVNITGDLAGPYPAPVFSPKIKEAEAIANLAMSEGLARVESLEARCVELEAQIEARKPADRIYLRMVEQRASKERVSWHKQLMINIDLKRKMEQLEQRTFLAERAMQGMAGAYTEGKAEATVVALVDYAAREIAIAQLLRKDALSQFDGLEHRVNQIQKIVENELLESIKRLERDERNEKRRKALEKEKRRENAQFRTDFRLDQHKPLKKKAKKSAEPKAKREPVKVQPGVIDYDFHMNLSKKLEEAAEKRAKKTAKRKSRQKR